MMPEIAERIRNHARESLLEFLDNVVRYRGEISDRLLGGTEISSIESLTGFGGDTHNNGRSVMGVTTNAGAFYYKPHDCAIDVLYHELVDALFSDCTIAADCVVGEGCGFVSEIVRTPLESVEGLHEY